MVKVVLTTRRLGSTIHIDVTYKTVDFHVPSDLIIGAFEDGLVGAFGFNVDVEEEFVMNVDEGVVEDIVGMVIAFVGVGTPVAEQKSTTRGKVPMSMVENVVGPFEPIRS